MDGLMKRRKCNFYASEGEKKSLESLASEKGMSVSAYIRALIQDAIRQEYYVGIGEVLGRK